MDKIIVFQNSKTMKMFLKYFEDMCFLRNFETSSCPKKHKFAVYTILNDSDPVEDTGPV